MTASGPAGTGAARIAFRGWGWRYPERAEWAVRGVDLTVEPGERVAVVGPSGAGKSTLLRAVAAVLPDEPDASDDTAASASGTVLVDGVDPRSVRGRVGLVMQDPEAHTVMSRIGDDVAFGCENTAVPRDETWARVVEALGVVDLDLPLDRSTTQLSGGQRQRLALAGVLAMRPGALVLDEPCANLDPAGVVQVHDAVRALLDETGATLLVVEHRIGTWLDLVDRLVLLEPAGGVVADGPVAEVLAAHGPALTAAGVWVPGAEPARGSARRGGGAGAGAGAGAGGRGGSGVIGRSSRAGGMPGSVGGESAAFRPLGEPAAEGAAVSASSSENSGSAADAGSGARRGRGPSARAGERPGSSSESTAAYRPLGESAADGAPGRPRRVSGGRRGWALPARAGESPGSSVESSAAFRPLDVPSALDTAAEPGAQQDVVLLEAVGLSTGRSTTWGSAASPASAASSPASTSGPGRSAAQAVGRGIDLRVRAGRVLAITGPNGVGKTTLGLTLAGLLPPVAGTLRATDALTRGAGPAPHAWSSRVLAARIGTVFQDPEHQIVARTVRDEVLAGPRALGHADTADGLEALLTTFGLAHLADVDPFTLSGGEQRRLAIASAIATRPPVLVLDEPTSGQDRATWEAVVQRLGALADDGTAVVVVTHDRDLVRALDADEVVLGPDGIVPVPAADGDVAVLAPVRRPDVAGLVMSAGAILPLGRDPEQDAPTVSETRAVSSGRVVPPGPSATRGVDGVQPVASLLGVLALGVCLVLSLDIVSAAVALAIEVVLLPLLRIPVWTLLVRTSPVLVAAPLTAVSIALYGSPSGREWFDLGFAHVTDGSLTLALATALRVLAVGVPALALFVRVDPTDLADGLAQVLRLPARFVLGALAAIRMTTLLVDDWRQLAMARRARGLADSGRLRRAASMAFSLLVLALRRATTLAVAMESRGFGAPGPRTWARAARFSWPEWAMVGVLVGIGAASIAVAVVAGTWRG
ncbi:MULTISPECIES: ATP-binding cassette domain-containing protein [unclassified Curtobacterium]|uniref:ATP-binding cassette domain-containing protein n=1 Tax=unclassified Curtobacterium TaxID=257496 RepID=UPI0008DD23A2|nr:MULTISPECIES: ATP-binding cassette domain-containing protein [unclassified Curtobacterium]OIH96883.1 hypothetical protein BIU92_04020 [Curtobacterium sp. MCBA15_003]OII09381.1 hypothetical protein BIU97_12750 [Curtobacterium sp. MCBA15_009]OII31071.1 hypothetical protein BIU94_05215 [Curtobacterium sp. MMLR14_006]